MWINVANAHLHSLSEWGDHKCLTNCPASLLQNHGFVRIFKKVKFNLYAMKHSSLLITWAFTFIVCFHKKRFACCICIKGPVNFSSILVF